MPTIRRAMESEAQALTDLAARSEAYWGYDADYMELFRSVYRVSEDFVGKNPTYVLEEDGRIEGFYSILPGGEASLEYLFIEPRSIGKGYGRLLWNHMLGECRKNGIKEFAIVTSPQAKEFYVRMGAEPCGEVESLLRKGRIIPRLIYRPDK